jgi:succinate dehydrogenase hydrophobic anchor subunit
VALDRGDDAVTAATAPPEPEATAPDVRSWTWHVQQLTSWLLLILLPVHLLSTWVFHDPGHFGVALYVDRWHHGVWRLFDGALVVVAFVHGGIGLDGAIGAHLHRDEARLVVRALIVIVLVVVGMLAVSAIMSFNLS